MNLRNPLDRFISFFSPEAAARRAKFRLLEQHLSSHARKYEGAARGRRGANWFASGASPNLEIAAPLPTLRNRSRDLVRNNPYAEKGIRFITAVTVGTGIIPVSTHPSERMAKKINGFWKEWGETTACDAARKLDIYGLQGLGMRSISEAGEGLQRRVVTRDKNWPIKVQALEPDHIATDRCEELPGGGRILHGVELDASGAFVALWIHPRHPGDMMFSIKDAIRIPEAEISHSFRVDRPGQLRGVPWLSPVMLRLKDFDEYVDAQLMRQKIAACWAAFIQDMEEPDDNPGASSTSAANAPSPEHFVPGMIETLPPGKTITLANPPGVQNYAEFSGVTLHSIAAGLGITYEALTSDLKGTNYSGFKGGKIDMDRLIKQWQFLMIIPQVCDRNWQWFNEGLVLTGRIKASDIYPALWTPPRREMVDPTKEVPAMKEAMRAGIMSRPAVIRELGDDPAQVNAEIAADNAECDRLGIVLDSDARHDVQNVPDNSAQPKEDEVDKDAETDSEIDSTDK